MAACFEYLQLQAIKNKLVYVKSTPQKSISIAEICKDAIYGTENYHNISATYSWKPTGNPNPFQAVFAECA
jgi:hypothetical protein